MVWGLQEMTCTHSAQGSGFVSLSQNLIYMFGFPLSPNTHFCIENKQAATYKPAHSCSSGGGDSKIHPKKRKQNKL